MHSYKSQSAVEFLTAYSYVFLIIAVMMAALSVYFLLPNATVPFQCGFYGGFNCADAELVMNNAGSALIVVGTSQQPGVINASSFNAILNFQNSTSGFCLPDRVTAGQAIYCIANFSFTPSYKLTYSGTFTLKAAYCAPGPQNVSTAACPSSSKITYSGSFRLGASAKLSNTVNAIINGSSLTLFYAPLKISNGASAASPAPFQQLVSFKASAYSKYEASDLGNIRFFLNGQELASWCESNCTSNAPSNSSFWVRLPNGIGPNSNLTVNMFFFSTKTEYDKVYAGEAPQLSPYYGEYDNGQNVFDFYDNFYGTKLNATKWQSPNPLATTVNNGLTLACSTASCSVPITANTIFYTSISGLVFETAMNVYGSTGTNIRISTDPVALSRFGNFTFGYWSTSTGGQPQYYWSTAYTGIPVSIPSSSNIYNRLDQQTYLTNGYMVWKSLVYPSYAPVYVSVTTLSGTGAVSPYLQAAVGPGGSSTAQLNVLFFRVRGAPPAQIMPTVMFGNVLRLT